MIDIENSWIEQFEEPYELKDRKLQDSGTHNPNKHVPNNDRQTTETESENVRPSLFSDDVHVMKLSNINLLQRVQKITLSVIVGNVRDAAESENVDKKIIILQRYTLLAYIYWWISPLH